MLGFFERQYLSYKKNHIKNLLALSRADGHMHPKETQMLIKIGRRYGLKERQVKEIIGQEAAHEVNVPDNFHDKMNLLYDLVMMVYADGVVEESEVKFCEDVVKRFGLKKDVVRWMLHEVFEKGTPPRSDEWEELIREAEEKFQTKK
jgi:uncharacterized tellurite resistance protein B-like protein